MPTTAPQYDISSEGESLPDENPDEAAPNDEEWLPDEVELNTVTISNMSIDRKPVATDGERGRDWEITVDSGAGESVVNPDEQWPNADLTPSQGSVRGQRYVGPGGEKTDNVGELTMKVRTEQHGAEDISSRVTLQGAKVRKPLLAVSAVNDKGNILVFDGNGSFILTGSCAATSEKWSICFAVMGPDMGGEVAWRVAPDAEFIGGDEVREPRRRNSPSDPNVQGNRRSCADRAWRNCGRHWSCSVRPTSAVFVFLKSAS